MRIIWDIGDNCYLNFNDTLSRRPGLHEEDEPVDMDRFCALDEISNLVDDHLKRKE